eukprot:2691205-Pleurochrysis_carterae.AAC.2
MAVPRIETYSFNIAGEVLFTAFMRSFAQLCELRTTVSSLSRRLMQYGMMTAQKAPTPAEPVVAAAEAAEPVIEAAAAVAAD